jgi:diguanylate cyclase (GGDEF)-like protein
VTSSLTDPVTHRPLEFVRDGPYAGADVINARRFSVAVHLLAVPAIALLALLWPPTARGSAGWTILVVIAATVAGKLVLVRRARGRRVFDVLLGSAYVLAAELGVLQWLAGGTDAPYHELFLGLLLLVALIHPRQRALLFAMVLVALAFSPALYGGMGSQTGDLGIASVLWLMAVGFCTTVMAQLRAQRTLLMSVRDAAEHDARRDQLTGLANRRSFEHAIAEALAVSRAAGRPLALAIGDVDRFKNINDRHGHLAGDRCLQEVAAALRGAARSEDGVFRWGGDEFAVLLECAAPGEAPRACDRLEAAVAIQVATPDRQAVTVTFGWALDDGAGTAEALMARADAALLARKRARRSAAAA